MVKKKSELQIIMEDGLYALQYLASQCILYLAS